MPFISPEEVKVKRNELKKAFPDWRFNVKTVNYTTIAVNIKSGPLDIKFNDEDRYKQVNCFYIDEHYSDRPELKKVLNGIKNIIGREQRELVYDGDYGSVPTYYIRISIGAWDKPYIYKPKKK